jgi:hypothetical protein
MQHEKSFFQKAVEKTLLLERNESFSIVHAEMDSGESALIVCLVYGGRKIPLAKLLSSQEITMLNPKLETLEPLTKLKVRAGKKILGSSPDDMLDIYIDSLADEAVEALKSL